MSSRWRLRLYCATALLKALLVSAPYSTDLLVHLHWKDLTTRYPVRSWYTEVTGPPYLDYPPLFAYVEWLLGQVAHLLGIPLTEKAGVVPMTTLAFMRLTVIALDAALFLGVAPWSSSAAQYVPSSGSCAAAQDLMLWVVTHPALWLVDHIHFQYNGFVLGFVLYSLGVLADNETTGERPIRLSRQRRWRGSAAYLIALGLKHTTALSVAPVVLFCLCLEGIWRDPMVILFGSCWLLLVLGMPFGNFDWRALYGRLFPFGERGLLHAYWAPNAYALLAAVDKVAMRLWTFTHTRMIWSEGVSGDRKRWQLARVSNSAGLVETGGGGFHLFPEWTPLLAAICSFIAMVPSLMAMRELFRKHTTPPREPGLRSGTNGQRQQQDWTCRREWLAQAGAQAALSMFLFGWHVHEKALILPTLLMGLGLGPRHPVAALLSAGCTLAMFPLVSAPAVRVVRLALILWHWAYFAPVPAWPQSSAWILVYAYCGIGLVLSELVAHWRGWQALGYPFIPLMLQSTYSAMAVLFSWVYLSVRLWRQTVSGPHRTIKSSKLEREHRSCPRREDVAVRNHEGVAIVKRL
jgi:alpha-1,3-glucosyltransferase